jgi:hypothetical protein
MGVVSATDKRANFGSHMRTRRDVGEPVRCGVTACNEAFWLPARRGRHFRNAHPGLYTAMVPEKRMARVGRGADAEPSLASARHVAYDNRLLEDMQGCILAKQTTTIDERQPPKKNFE